MKRRNMRSLGSCGLAAATGLIFLTTAHIAFAQQAPAGLPVPLKRMIVTLPTPAAATTTPGTPAGSATATPTGTATATTLPSTVNVNITPTDRVVTTTKTTAVWVPETNPPPPQAGTTKKKVLNGTDECVTISDVASPAKQAQTAAATAVLYFECSLTAADSNRIFTVTVDGDVTIDLVSVVAFDSANRPIPLALELKQGQQQNQTKCPFTTAICASATAGQAGTGSSGAGTGASGTTGTTGTGTSASNVTKPPATLQITIKGAVPAGGGVLRVTAPSKQIHAGTVTYHATDKQRVWRQIMIANGAQHSPQNTTGTQGGAGNQGCGEANPTGQSQPGGASQQSPPPSWTVGAEVVVLDPTRKTVVLSGKLGRPILCDDLAVLDDAIRTLDAVIQAVSGPPDQRTADAVLQKWKNVTTTSLVPAETLLLTISAIEDEIYVAAMNAVNAELRRLADPAIPISPEPFQTRYKKIENASDGLKSVPEVVLFLDKLAVLAKAAGDHNPEAHNDAHRAAVATLETGTTDLHNLREKLKTFTRNFKNALRDATDEIENYNHATRDFERFEALLPFYGFSSALGTIQMFVLYEWPDASIVRDLLVQARRDLANHDLTSAETVVQRLAVEIDADHKYVDLGTLFGPSGSSAAPANIGQLPRVVRLVNTLAVPASCGLCASAPESVVIPAATVINVDLPGCLRGTVNLAAALPPGPAPPSGGVGRGLPPNNYCGLTITEAFLNVAYLPVANTLDPGLRVLGASKKPAAAWLPLSAANGQLNYLQAEAFHLTTEPADNIAYFDSRAGQIALKLPKTSKNPESIWSISTSVANLTIDNTVDDWSTALNAIAPNLAQLILAITQPPAPAGGAAPDPDTALAALCRLINLDSTAKVALAKVPNQAPQAYLISLNRTLAAATTKAKAYDALNTKESNATTLIAVIDRQARQLKNRRGRDDFNPRLLELEIEREDQHAQKTDDHLRKRFIGGELLDVVGKF